MIESGKHIGEGEKKIPKAGEGKRGIVKPTEIVPLEGPSESIHKKNFEPPKETTVVEDTKSKEVLLRELQTRVDRAAEAAPVITGTFGEPTEENKKDARSLKEYFDTLPDDHVLTYDFPQEQPNEITLADPQYYPSLVRMGVKKVRKDNVETYVTGFVSHEFAHASEALKTGVQVHYGIRFARQEGTNELGVQPFIEFAGSLTKKDYLNIVKAPAHIHEAEKLLIDRPEQ